MHRNSKIALTLAAVVAAFLAIWTTSAGADPSPIASRLQLAQDQLANCQLLANNATSSSQRSRAQQCVTDQQRIIALLTGQSPSPSPSTTTTPTPTPSPTPTGDTQAPSAPTGLAATIRPNLDIMITWSASTDNVGVVDYLFERDTTQLGVTTTPDWLDVGRSAGTTYTYRVRARDSAGNISAYSATLSVTTPTASPSPTTTTVTPTPTSSPTGGTKLGCRNQLSAVGCGYPDGSNTGPAVGSILQPLNGNQSITTDGTTISNVTITGCVDVNANNVVITNSRILAGGCFFAIRNFGKGLIIKDTEVTCQGYNGNAIVSTDFTAIRVNIHNCENGFGTSGNVTVQDSYIHDLESDNGAHTDAAQFDQGAANLLFMHNTMITPTPGGTSAIIMWNEGDPQNTNVTIKDNFLIGGTYTLYCPRMNATNIFITNNRFGEFEYGNTDACDPGHVTTFTGNFRDDGTPLNS